MPPCALRLRPAILGLLSIVCPVAITAFASDPIKEVGHTATEWVKTRAETVRLETAWTQERALLASTVNGLKERAVSLEDKRDHVLSTTAESRAEQAALATKLADSQENLRLTETRLLALTAKVVSLRSQLPPRLSDALEMSYRTLASSGASAGERMQQVMTVLNRCAQFNLTITEGDETLTLPGEPGPKSLDVIYWGLSHGYALDRAGGKAWLGTPGASGWQWEPIADAAPAVTALLAIRRDAADPQLVRVPARLKSANTP
jgi:hypothetical protein